MCRLTNPEMKEFGIVDDSDDTGSGKEQGNKTNTTGSGSGTNSTTSSGTGDGGLAMDEEMIGIHFLEIPVLYVMYLYVCTGKWVVMME